MSLRRKSCNACFRGRRKCNLAYPTCEYCRKTKKCCQYAYPPTSGSPSSNDSTSSPAPSGPAASTSEDSFTALLSAFDTSTFDFLETGTIPDLFLSDQPQSPPYGSPSNLEVILPHTCIPPYPSLPSTSIRKFLGPLGEIQPIQGINATWQWLIETLSRYPADFAATGETIFIHNQLYRDSMPRSIRTAFGISSSSCLRPGNQAMMFRVIEAEVNDLLQPTHTKSAGGQAPLLDDLASLQSLLLYQIIRLFHSTGSDADNLKQRTLAEQQGTILMTRALKLLSRSQELAPKNRQAWITAECIRRTVVVIYMLYGVNSICREGICIGLPTLVKLPISAGVGCWNGEGTDASVSMSMSVSVSGLGYERTMPYEKFLECWLVSKPRRLDAFERLLLVPCQGVEAVDAFHDLAGFM
ncbi:Zn(II)2Cys6 transcription factor domain-containing protein [Aspergillus mulundensis]|uniref:Zn(2)-C6 fungal-type domain-containing protein n=1 Tax=Aspergillus mulundensis TaxID=1810919 RepID=A0A3D8SD22_9EURO|nr:hypothetical protein DSM5745_04387 [Aspergillus mulundensis]RDW84061.1 hypothetical protein DSM5745_04387 [Aspergillus mulundensis]